MRLGCFILVLLFSCSEIKQKDEKLFFTSHGIVIETRNLEVHVTENNQNIDIIPRKIGDIYFLTYEWKAGLFYSLKGSDKSFQAPEKASPYLLRKIPLENADKLVASGNFPDTDLSISSDARLVAIGTYFGYIRVFDLSLNKILWEKKLSEGMVKKVYFSEKNDILVVGEQSFDGFIYGFDSKTGAELWKYRLAADLGESAPPKIDDLYGIYSLPGVFHIVLLNDKNILIAGLHSWFDGKNTRQKSKLYSFNSDGKLNWTFPKNPLMGNIQYFAATEEYITFSVSSLINKTDESGIKESSVVLLNTKTGQLLDYKKIEPLKPHFTRVAFWQSISIDPGNRFVNMGSYDGRAFIFSIRKGKIISTQAFNLGTPIFIQNIPIMAGISFTCALNNLAIFSVNQTSIPYSYSRVNKITEPPSLHPVSGTLFAYNSTGKLKWKHQDGFVYSAVQKSLNGKWFIATIDDKKVNREKNYFGFSLFKRKNDDSFEKIYSYNSFVPAFFRGAISNDGLIKAIITAPYIRNKNDKIHGKYEVHVIL